MAPRAAAFEMKAKSSESLAKRIKRKYEESEALVT